ANRTSGNLQAPVSAPDIDDWREQRRDIADIGGYFHIPGSTGVDLSGDGDPQRLSAAFVTPGFFSTLGVTPMLGRLPREDEMVRGGPDRVVVLSHRFWQRQFAGSRGVADSTITLGNESYRVLGALAPGMRFPSEDVDVYIPYSSIPDASIPRIRVVRILDVVARARDGVPMERVQLEMRATTKRLAATYAENTAWDDATVAPLHDAVTGGVRRSLWVLLGAVGFVLLIACVNVASLQLARATARSREIAVRMALGAGRGRVIRQLVTESAVLGLAGGVAGLVLAKGGLHALLALGSGQIPRGAEVTLDAGLAGFALCVSVVCGVLFGLAPAVLASGNVQQTLRSGGRGVAGSGDRLRNALVIGEVALAVMLVIGGGLMTRSFIALMHEDPGFRPDNLLALNFTLSTSRLANFRDAYRQIIEAARAQPGVLAAGAVKNAPFNGNGEVNSFRIPGMVIPSGEESPTATVLHVSDGYFATIGARMLEGREFAPQDRADAPPVVVVNEAFARRWFAGIRATEQRILLGNTAVPIVGVVNDIRQVSMSTPAVPTIYVHNQQNGRVQTTLVVRTAGDPMALANAMRQVVWSVDRLQPITSVFTFDDAVHGALARPRLLTVLLGAFGGLGLLLGAVGLYGVLAYLVSQRQREIGIRIAIGAMPGAVSRMVVRRGLALTLIGVVIGVAGALATSRYMAEVLYGIAPTDPATFVGVAVVLLGVAALASWIPARRAAAVDPVVVLRLE
ncbi:MAG: ABC transporter permease, partial [bacterium]